MFVHLLEKLVINIKDVNDLGLFGVMSRSSWFVAFGSTPAFFIMLPMIGILLSIQALLNAYDLLYSYNRNFDRWFRFIISVCSACCASVSLYGAVISAAIGTTFVAGPYFFLAGTLCALLHECIMMGINCYRAYESREDSDHYFSFIQAVCSHFFNTILLISIVGAVVFVMLTPIAPVIGSIFALSALSITVLNIAWRIAPSNWKEYVKSYCGLTFTDAPALGAMPSNLTMPLPIENKAQEPQIHRTLFSHHEYRVTVQKMPIYDGVDYLGRVIKAQMRLIREDSVPLDIKSSQQLKVLEYVHSELDTGHMCTKKDLLKKYPLAFESFWKKIGDVEAICDAALWLQTNIHSTELVQ